MVIFAQSLKAWAKITISHENIVIIKIHIIFYLPTILLIIP